MHIILISGKAQNGKDQSAKIIKQKLEQKNKKVLITAYGDLVKYVCEKFFNWDGKKDEKGRTLLQYVGTDIVRSKKFNFWVDFIINVLNFFDNEWDYVLIPDMRFQNEIHRWNGLWDITTLRVNRLNFENNLTYEQKNHSSETKLDNYHFDYVINVESGLDKLEKEIDKFVKWMEEIDE